MVEEWLDVIGYEGFYQVSNLGRVRSVDRSIVRKNGKIFYKKGRVLKQTLDSHYPRFQVSLCKNGVENLVRVHTLVASAFLGSPPKGLIVCHGTKGSLCNEIANLYYGTHETNSKDKVRDGTSNRGEKHHKVKLTEKDVIAIRVNKESLSDQCWAERLNVSRRAVNAAKNGQTWSWL